ncbi:MAG: hypothetical protein ACRCTY_08375, partial [Candidatus Adiutrix sp.]
MAAAFGRLKSKIKENEGKMKRKSYFKNSLFLTAILGFSLILAGCPLKINGSPVGSATKISKVDEPWTKLAPKLIEKGFSQKQINDFFGSNNLLYSSKPMETKLRELHGIFYRSDLTREIQEKLFQLGYEIHIDGRYGSG